MSRNIGGSFGISIAQTWLARRAQFHQGMLVGHLTPGNPVYEQRLAGLARAIGGDPVGAMRQATGARFGTVQKQAQMLAYLDIFHWMAMAALVTIPLVFLLRRIDQGKARAGH